SGMNVSQPMTRRRALVQSAKFVGLAGLAATGLATAGITFARHGWDGTIRSHRFRTATPTPTPTPPTPTPTQAPVQSLVTNISSDSINNAFRFQDLMMDLYAQGNTLRLSQSFSDQADNGSIAYVYDI